MVVWHYWLNGYEFEQVPGDSEGQGSLDYCSSWGHRVGHNLATYWGHRVGHNLATKQVGKQHVHKSQKLLTLSTNYILGTGLSTCMYYPF